MSKKPTYETFIERIKQSMPDSSDRPDNWIECLLEALRGASQHWPRIDGPDGEADLGSFRFGAMRVIRNSPKYGPLLYASLEATA